MYRVVHGNETQSPDVQDFIDLLNNQISPARELFNSKADLIVSRAPGRLDLTREIESEYLAQLLERMSGETFLTRYKATSDPVTSIDREKEYAIRMPTAHPIYENARVLRFVDLLDQCDDSDAPELLFNDLGALMYASHRSYTALGLNSAGTDLLVDLVRREGPDAGLFGAKITGGGSGGRVAVLGDQTSRAAVERVVASYAKETGHQPHVFSGSSSGSLALVICDCDGVRWPLAAQRRYGIDRVPH